MPKPEHKCEKCGKVYQRGGDRFQKHVDGCKGRPERGGCERGSAKDLSRKMDAFRKKLGWKPGKRRAPAPQPVAGPAGGPSAAIEAARDAMVARRDELTAELDQVGVAIQTLEGLLRWPASRGAGNVELRAAAAAA